MKRKTKKFALLMTATTLAASAPINAFGASFTDIEGHWAQQTIQRLADDGIISGMGDGTFAPNAGITRAQYFTMVNNAFGFTEEAEIGFSDVNADDWFASQIRRAVAAGYLTGYEDNTAKPNANITRAEVSVVLKSLLNLPESPGASDRFGDANTIPAWARASVDAVVGAGLLRGDTEGNFRAVDNITRAESAIVINNSNTYRSENIGTGQENQESQVKEVRISSDYGNPAITEVIEGNVTVVNGVTVRNVVIKGDLIVDEAVGNGTVNLSEVTVEGKVIVNGRNVTVAARNSEFELVELFAERSIVRLTGTNIENLHLKSGAVNSRVTLDSTSVINFAEIDAESNFTGTGRINTALINVSGVRADSGLIRNYAQGSRRATTNNSTSGGGSSSGGSGGTAATPSPTPPAPQPTPPTPTIPQVDPLLAEHFNAPVIDRNFMSSGLGTIRVEIKDTDLANIISLTYDGEAFDVNTATGIYIFVQESELTGTDEEIKSKIEVVINENAISNRLESSVLDMPALGMNAYIHANTDLDLDEMTVTVNGATARWSDLAGFFLVGFGTVAEVPNTVEVVVTYKGIEVKYSLTVEKIN